MERFTLRALALLATLGLFLTAAVPFGAASPGDEPADWERMLDQQGPSHASGGRPELGPTIIGNPTQAVVTLRVGLYYSYTATGGYSEFASLDHPSVRLTNTSGTARVLDVATGKQLAVMEPGKVFEVRADGDGYAVTGPSGPLGTHAGPIRFRPNSADNLFQVESINRTINGARVTPQYRGAMEVARGSQTAAGKVNLVNVVELESYVRGVVVNESLASFHVEALKAQATAARGYAVANVGKYQNACRQAYPCYPFDLVDSSASQVYRGASSEHPKGNQATDETRGLVASYAGKIITAYYSSSMGGHTEGVEWIFNEPNDQWPGDNTTPYLRGIYDGEGAAPDLSTEEAIRAFWANPQPQTYDACERVGNRFARWRIEILGSLIRSRVAAGVTSGTVGYDLESGTTAGDVTGVEVVERMSASKRIGVARVRFSTGSVLVKGWRNVRAVLGTNGPTSAPTCPGRSPVSPNFVLNNPSVIDLTYKADGTVDKVVAWGGGWGHNVGMSQFGANGRALAGQSFMQILKGYYTGVDVGSYPIDIGRGDSEPGAGPAGPPLLRQEFYSPTGGGTLEIRARGMRGLRVHINETYDVILSAEDLAAEVVRVDLSAYLNPGANVVQYNPVGNTGTATVVVIVE